MKALSRFDRRLTKTIQEIPGSWQPVMSGMTFLGEPVVVLAIGFTGFLSAAARNQGRIEHAFIYAAAAFFISTALKLVLRRARPHNLDIRTLGVRSYSFPSGHAFGTVTFYGLFSYLDYKYLTRPWSLVIAILIWLLIVLIGVSRVYLKYHYPSDVAAGWLLGLISLVVVAGLAF
jgi:membrane-associated phospholipid phosphatase